MKLFVLKATHALLEDTPPGLRFNPYVDIVGFVIRAASEEEARSMAEKQEMGGPWWKNPCLTSCERFRAHGDPAIILADVPTG